MDKEKQESLDINSFNSTSTQDNDLNNPQEKEEEKQEQKNNNVVDALDKEVQRRKKELYELSELIRKTKEENQSIVEKMRNENIENSIKELKPKYNFSDEDVNVIVNEIKSKYNDAITKEKISDLIVGTYYALHPEKIKEMESKLEKISSNIASFQEKQLQSSSAGYEPQSGMDELTPEEREIVQKFGVKPETIKKMKSGEGFSILSSGAKKYNPF